MIQNKNKNSSSRDLYRRKKSQKQIQSIESKPKINQFYLQKEKKSQKQLKLIPKNRKNKIKGNKNQHLKTQQHDINQGLPYVKRNNPKRNLKQFANLTSNLKGISHLDFIDNEYLTQKNQNGYHKTQKSNCLQFIKKSLQQNQKTLPFEHKSNSTQETANLIRQIIAKSRSRANLNNPFNQAYNTNKNDHSISHVNQSTSINRKYSQSHNKSQKSQEKGSQKKLNLDKCLYQFSQMNKNIRSCKQINLFRINSKKNLTLQKNSNQQQKLRSLKSIQKSEKQFNNIRASENILQPSKSSRYGYGILGNKQQNILKNILKSKKSSQLQIKENISHNTNTLPSINTLQFDQKNISQIKELEISQQISDQQQKQLSIPSIDCSIICEDKQQFNQSSFLNETAKMMIDKFNNKDRKQNTESLDFKQISSKNSIIPNGQLKKIYDQKSRKKILQIDKLRKKFPTDFFKN